MTYYVGVVLLLYGVFFYKRWKRKRKEKELRETVVYLSTYFSRKRKNEKENN